MIFGVYDIATRRRALALLATGMSQNAVSKEMHVSRAALRSWVERLEPTSRRATTCFGCGDDDIEQWRADTYGYLLGLYLGDGCLSRAPRDVWILRVFCADAWPGLIEECRRAMESVVPGNRAGLTPAIGCTVVQMGWKHWTCVFPQHGPGRKHTRPIVLATWQAAFVTANPRPLLRGLFHSDGCRITNWTTKTVAGARKRYEYPRYLFVNESQDILGLCAQALDALGIAYTTPKANTISVARKAAVAALDEFVGPKY